MSSNRRRDLDKPGWALAATLLLGACEPSGAGLVLAVAPIPATAQKLNVTVYANQRSLSQHTFDSGVAGQSSIELGYRIAEEKIGLDLRFVIEALDGQCRLAQGSVDYKVSAPARFSVPVALSELVKLSSVPQLPALTAVHGSSENNVWAVSADGRLVRWDGCSWSVAGSVSKKQLNTVYVAGPDEVWAAGADAQVVHYAQGTLTEIPAVIQGAPVQGTYKGIWQAAPFDVWLVGSNAATDLCLLHHWDGSKLEDFSQLCATGLGAPKIVDLNTLSGVTTAEGTTLYAGGERNMSVLGGGSSAAALLVKKGSAAWQAVALNALIASKAERVYSLFALSPDEVVLGVNHGSLIHYKSPDFTSGRELVVDAARSPSLDDTIIAISGDSQRNLFLLYEASSGTTAYRSRGAVTPWNNVSSALTSYLPAARSLFAPSPSSVFLVGVSGLATKQAIP